MYYNSDRLFSYQAPINFVLGERGNGKSFEAKKRMIRNFLQKGEQSIYIRRRQTDIDEVKDLFFDDIAAHFPDTEFKIDGKYGYINGEIAVIFMSLSTSLKKKSSPFPRVTLLVFDEYLEPAFKFPNYLKNDMFLLLELLNTVVRSRNNWTLLLIGNVVSFVNPFFSMYNIQIRDTKKRFHRYMKDKETGKYMICIELTETPKFKEEYAKTNLAKIIKHTTYGDYAMGGVAYEDNNDYIMPERFGTHIFICSLYSQNKELGIWFNGNADIYVDDKVEKDSKNKFYMFDDDMKEGYFNVKLLKKWQGKQLAQGYREGRMFYKNQEIKKTMQDFIKHIG